MKTVFLDTATIAPESVDLSVLHSVCDDFVLHELTAQDDVIARCSDASIVITNKVVLDAKIIRNLPNLKCICVAATGVNNIDVDAAVESGITVCNVPGYSTNGVAQHVFAGLLHLTHHLEKAASDWPQSPMFCMHQLPTVDLAGQTMGLIGYGAIAQRVEQIASILGMRVIVAERRNAPCRSGRTPFDEVLKTSDVLSLHCPLTDDTINLIDQQELEQIKATAIVINTSRGPVVNAQALAEALDAGTIGGAVIDVLDAEPPPSNHPLIQCRSERLLLTPHIAWASIQSRQSLVNTLAANITAFASNKPQNVVAVN